MDTESMSDRRIVPTTVLDLGDGRRWVAVADRYVARLAGALSETAVEPFFEHDLERGLVPSLFEYYALAEGSDEPGALPVVLRVCKDPQAPTGWGGTMVVGVGNQDPYPAHGEGIAALATHLGVDLGEHRYPYGDRRRAPTEPDVTDEPGTVPGSGTP